LTPFYPLLVFIRISTPIVLTCFLFQQNRTWLDGPGRPSTIVMPAADDMDTDAPSNPIITHSRRSSPEEGEVVDFENLYNDSQTRLFSAEEQLQDLFRARRSDQELIAALRENVESLEEDLAHATPADGWLPTDRAS
jgi:hypothetical protein